MRYGVAANGDRHRKENFPGHFVRSIGIEAPHSGEIVREQHFF